jgi:hypothetical protein
MKNEIVKLGIDLYRGSVGQFSTKESNDVLRKAIKEMNGGSDKLDYKSFRRNKVELFEIIEEILPELVVEGLENQFDGFAEVRNLKLGDKNEFHIPNRDLFDIAIVSDGNGNLRRQRIGSDSILTVPTTTYAVKIYEEFNRFLAGRIDWVEMVNRIAKAFGIKLKNDVYNAIYNSFSDLSATYGVSAAYSEATLTEIAQHVEAATNTDVLIFGTKGALSKVAPSTVSDKMRDEKNQTGFYGVVNGFELREIKQSHQVGTDTFAIDNNFLLIVPTLEDRMVKIVNEGDAFIQENPGGQNADMSMEYLYGMKMGMSLIASSRYGIYRLA